MIRKMMFVVLLILFASGTAAQSGENPFIVRVRVESAFIRLVPDFDAEPVASVFENDRLLVVSRNLDGTWFEVRRPGRLTNLGWIFEDTLEWDFQPETLPLGDWVTGVTGPTPIPPNAPFAAYLKEGPALRALPSRHSERLMNIPPELTIPVLERNQDGSWLHVNYLGHEGWIIGFTTRTPNLMAIPEAPDAPPPETRPVVVIPVELQQAQIDRLREFIQPRRELAAGLESFWWSVYRGQIMPCDIPPTLSYYPYSEEDVRDLPELERYMPRLATAIDYLMAAREPFLGCGVVSPEIVGNARDSAINAHIIFDATLERIDDLERNVVQTRR